MKKKINTCKWLHSMGEFFGVSCVHALYSMTKNKHCPYCGKPIEVIKT